MYILMYVYICMNIRRQDIYVSLEVICQFLLNLRQLNKITKSNYLKINYERIKE